MTDAVARRQVWIAIGVGAALLALGVWIVVAALPSVLTTAEPAAPPESAGAGVEARRIHAALFYVSSNGTELVAADREVPYGVTRVDQLRRILEAQIAPPPNGVLSAIPAGTTIRAVFLSDRNEAFVDLGGAIVSGHPGGSLNEALTVYTIVNAVTINMPDVTSVQILVEGREVDSLVGHVDLRYPLAKATDWIRKGQ